MLTEIRNTVVRDQGDYKCEITFANRTLQSGAKLSVKPSNRIVVPVVVEKRIAPRTKTINNDALGVFIPKGSSFIFVVRYHCCYKNAKFQSNFYSVFPVTQTTSFQRPPRRLPTLWTLYRCWNNVVCVPRVWGHLNAFCNLIQLLLTFFEFSS